MATSSSAKACIAVGAICLLLGILFVFIGTFGVRYEVSRLKNDYLVIDSKESPQYKDWSGGYDEQVEYDMVFYFFNLTNPDDVRTNAVIPKYTTVGPYIYRRYRKSVDVSFLDGGNEVQFADYREYQFNQQSSSGSKFDRIVNLNPVFLSALGQAGSEAQMLGGAAGGYFPNFTNYFTGNFTSVYTSFVLPDIMQNVTDAQINTINEVLHDTTSAMDYFLDAWCNGTNLTIGNWTGLLLSEYYSKPTNISKDSAMKLLDPSITLSLLNKDNITAWAWDRSLTNSSYTGMITKTFGITSTQLEAIWYWRVKYFGPTFIYPKAIEKYNLEDISDIGYVQWMAGYDILGGTVAAPVSIFDLFPTPEIGYYSVVELFLFPADPLTFTDWRIVKEVLNPKTGLGNMTIFQDFALAMSNQNSKTNFSQWGMTEDQAEQMYDYIFTAGITQVVPALQSVFGDSGGLILNQTVDDWVFNCNYFLINLLLPVPPSCSLLLNGSNFNTATILSGKNNISEINQYVKWNGSPVVSGVWAHDIPVWGNTELGQFPPNQNSETLSLYTFNDEFVRTVTLNRTTNSTVRNISTNHFVLDYPKMFSPNPLYFQNTSGFANLTSFKQAPIFYSLWDMLYVNESIRNMVSGLDEPTNEDDCSTTLDVEPITGNTLKLRKRVQANMNTPPNCDWCSNSASYLNNFAFPENTFFPLVKAGEYTEVTEALAATVRSKLGEIKSGPRYGLIVGLSVGIFLVVLGVALMVFGKRKLNQGYYRLDDYTFPSTRR